jgi:hypothetical protein
MAFSHREYEWQGKERACPEDRDQNNLFQGIIPHDLLKKTSRKILLLTQNAQEALAGERIGEESR